MMSFECILIIILTLDFFFHALTFPFKWYIALSYPFFWISSLSTIGRFRQNPYKNLTFCNTFSADSVLANTIILTSQRIDEIVFVISVFFSNIACIIGSYMISTQLLDLLLVYGAFHFKWTGIFSLLLFDEELTPYWYSKGSWVLWVSHYNLTYPDQLSAAFMAVHCARAVRILLLFKLGHHYRVNSK